MALVYEGLHWHMPFLAAGYALQSFPAQTCQPKIAPYAIYNISSITNLERALTNIPQLLK
jgi:hypothetical protein